MKTSQLKKIIEDNGLRLKVRENVYEIYSKDLYLCSVGKEDNYIYIDYPCPKNIAQTIVDYAYTHLEEREEERKYRLRVPFDFNHYQYLNVDLDAKQYFVDDNEEFDGVKNSFTQKQIDEMPKSWQEFFIKEEVK